MATSALSEADGSGPANPFLYSGPRETPPSAGFVFSAEAYEQTRQKVEAKRREAIAEKLEGNQNALNSDGRNCYAHPIETPADRTRDDTNRTADALAKQAGVGRAPKKKPGGKPPGADIATESGDRNSGLHRAYFDYIEVRYCVALCGSPHETEKIVREGGIRTPT